MSRPKLLHTHSTLLDRSYLTPRRPRNDAYITAVGAEIVSALSPLSSPVAGCSSLLMIDMSDSLARYVETGVDLRCCEPLWIASDFEDNESTARREACCLGNAVFSRAPNWVGRSFMFARQPWQEPFHLLFRCCGCLFVRLPSV